MNRHLKVLLSLALSLLVTAATVQIAAAAEADDNIPGTAFTAPGPVSGTLNASSDQNDVYSMSMVSGVTYSITAVPPEKSAAGNQEIKWGVELFDPKAAGITTATPVAKDLEGNRDEVASFVYAPTVSGTYYINVKAISGNGEYQLYARELTGNEIAPGKKIKYGKLVSDRLAPVQNITDSWYSIPVDNKKAQSIYFKKLKFTGAVAGDLHYVNVQILDPNGNEIGPCYEDGCEVSQAGSVTLKPSKIGLHSFRVYSYDLLPSIFSMAVTEQLGTELVISTSASEKERKSRYEAKATVTLTPRQSRAKVKVNFRKCKSNGTGCSLVVSKTGRIKKNGKATVSANLKTGRYAVEASFKGTSKRLGSESESQCLAVGPEGTCIE